MARPLWAIIKIRLIFRFMGQKEFQRMYWPVKPCMVEPKQDTINNFSNYKLSLTEEFFLSCGLNFCILINSVQKEEIFAKFEVLIGQLLHHVPHSSEQFSALKARLSDLAHAYCGNPVNIGDFLISRVH